MSFEESLIRRPRRLRQSVAIRSLVRETRVSVDDLIQPLFVVDGERSPEGILSMPGQYRFCIRDLVAECKELNRIGIKAVALFPSLDDSLKDSTGKEALNSETLILRALREVKQAVPELILIADIALDPYTDHGHDGVLTTDKQDVENDSTVKVLAKMAVLNGKAGADFVAPSDMMDGRVGAIRETLDDAGMQRTGIIAYSAKFNSAYYGPFRDAVGSAKAMGSLLGKDTYQLDPANGRQAMAEILLDETEGADVLMVKPAGSYLDIIRQTSDATELPVAAYQVSGEYAQICAAASLGWLDFKRIRDESLLSIKRAGSDLIFTYFAKAVAQEIAGEKTTDFISDETYENQSGI